MKLLLIEGIAGSGKTTTSKKVSEYLTENNVQVECYQEGDLHPCDLAWHSCVPINIYEELLKKYSDFTDQLNKYTNIEDDYAYVAYTKLEITPKDDLYNELIKYELYDGKSNFETFKYHHLKRWTNFSNNNENKLYIFECAFLQNHIVELMLIYQLEKEEILQYMNELISTVLNLEPMLIYLSPASVEWTIKNAAQERRTDNPEVWSHWIDRVIEYICESSYGKSYSLKGIEGVIKFFEERKSIEEEIINLLPINSISYKVNQDWDRVIPTILDDVRKGITSFKR